MDKPKINNKFHMYQLFLKNQELLKLVPETKIFTEINLYYLMEKYKNVVVKPSRGSLGNGIIMVSEVGFEEYEILVLNKKKSINGKKEIFKYLKKHENRYIPQIVQAYIPLARIFARPIDLRYITQQENNDWVVSGKYAKVAKEGYAVTNFAHGSTILTVEEALKSSSIKNLNINETLFKLDSITLSIAKCLSQYFTKQMIWGCDLAIDENGSIWIIEANAAPQTKGFLEIDSLVPIYKNIERLKILNKKRTN